MGQITEEAINWEQAKEAARRAERHFALAAVAAYGWPEGGLFREKTINILLAQAYASKLECRQLQREHDLFIPEWVLRLDDQT